MPAPPARKARRPTGSPTGAETLDWLAARDEPVSQYQGDTIAGVGDQEPEGGNERGRNRRQAQIVGAERRPEHYYGAKPQHQDGERDEQRPVPANTETPASIRIPLPPPLDDECVCQATGHTDGDLPTPAGQQRRSLGRQGAAALGEDFQELTDVKERQKPIAAQLRRQRDAHKEA